MFDYALQWVRTLGHRFFLRFGLHCATHQIRVILISCVVITSLFYPALALYSSSQPKSLSIIDTFISPSTVSGFHAQQDLVNIWSGYSTLRVHEDAVSRAKCGVSRALRVERILIQSPLVEDDGALNHQILLETLNLETRLERLISSGETPCLKRPDGKCLVLSPLAFWDYDKQALLADTNILDTLSYSKNVSIAGIPVTPQMVLASRGSHEHHVAGSKFDFAMFLALTYFFPDSDCILNTEHTAWLQAVHNAASHNAEMTVQIQEPTLIALEYDLELSSSKGWSALSTFLYFAYIGFFAYVAWSVRRMDAVHSRIGVTFTALTEIAVSTITSLSVCALVGFKVTMVPWELLPIVIVFVGAENMFNLVDAVGKTSVTLSVKQRIAEGLSRAGTSNTLKVVCYNSILGVIAVFSVGAIQQFCIFAIVVLVAHWFLAHTFFMAVLSIDIQRLELDELLRHDASLGSTIPQSGSGGNTKQPRSGWQKLVVTVQNLLRGRAATNISLLMLLAITATLYYTTYSASTATHDDPSLLMTPFGAVSRIKSHTDAGLDHKSVPWHIWKTINLNKASLLHLRIEMPTIVTFRPNIDNIDLIRRHKAHRPRFSIQTLRLVLWLLKIMVLPIAATTSALYGLLLYLLKNAELLEAQRNRADASPGAAQEEGLLLEGQVSFVTLPRAFASDVELIAASKDGQVVVSVGLHNEIFIWKIDVGCHISVDATDILLRSASTSSAASTLTSVAVDDKGEYCAVGTGAGVVAAWAIERDSARALPPLSLENSSASVTDLQFLSVDSRIPERTPPFMEQNFHASLSETPPELLATYESGVALKWSLGDVPGLTHFTASRRAQVVKCSLVRVLSDKRLLVAFCMNDGTLELLDTAEADPPIMPDCSIQAGNSVDAVSKVHACCTELNGSTRLIVATATEAGFVSLWDALTGECITLLEDPFGRINHLRVSPVQCETCRFCGQLPLESLSIAFSIDHVIQFYKLYLNDQTRRCSCSQNQPRHKASRESLDRRSRSNSTSSAMGSSSPLIPRARLATAFAASQFPVSGHGVHSRRVSEKDSGRRSSELLTVPMSGDEYELGFVNAGAPDASGTPPSFWRNALVVRVADTTCERGGWGVSGGRLVGVRRKPRIPGKITAGPVALAASASTHGLTNATLERWELWTFDPSAARLQSSLLAGLVTQEQVHRESAPSPAPFPARTSTSSSSSSSDGCIPRLPFTRVSPLLIASSHALAGFGNTVGIFKFSAQS